MQRDEQELELVRRLRERQPRAFALLYERYKAPLWQLAFRLARNRPLAEDLFQETWLAAARYAHRLGAETHLLAWLCTVLRSKHQNARRVLLSDELKLAAAAVGPLEPPTPEQVAHVRGQARKAASAFGKLPEVYREVLVLSAVEGLDGPQMAAVLDIQPDAARQRLSRALSQLANLMEKP